MSTREAATALRRFGLGARPGDIKAIAGDPRGFVLQQCGKADAGRLDDPDLDPSHVVFAEAQRLQQQQRAAKEAGKQAQNSVEAKGAPVPMPASQPVAVPAPPAEKAGAVRRDAFQDELSARFDRAVTTNAPFVERLVLFWSNHFCVSASKGPVRGLAGGYEREAIRPHILGRFADMLKATAQHPAMLIYLDNQVSIGPNSQAGKSNRRGLNENLAREILELHTLGVDGGYSQDDVTNFARILTGWTVGNVNQPNIEAGKFTYASPRHEPGVWTVLGKAYENKGLQTGEDVLASLARHPATARHLARKLARHFHSDEPPPALVQRLEQAYRKTDGDLGAVARELAASPELWQTPPRKIVPPYDFVVSLVRGFGYRPKAPELGRLASALGQPTWNVTSPQGWPDSDDAWMGPSAVRERLRIAEQLARMMDKLTDPRVLATEILGDGMSDETRAVIARAESREQGFELLVMAPEFLRR